MKIQIINSNSFLYPERLKNLKKMPNKIYCVGNMSILNSYKTVGIVGSRNCTEYGRKVAFSFAKKLAENGFCIVSGMAIGIDGAAHLGAIQKDSSTIAVIGSGLNNLYPEENEWLFNKIIKKNGVIISEYEPDIKAEMSKFSKRNRIIAALSDILIVVEAEYRSGSSITLNYAKKYEKIICAIPSNIYSSNGIGTNKMIQEGAILITKPEQIIELFKINNKSLENEKIKLKKIPSEYSNVYNVLSNNPMHINELSKKLRINLSELASKLTMMEIEGLIIQNETNYFVKNERR